MNSSMYINLGITAYLYAKCVANDHYARWSKYVHSLAVVKKEDTIFMSKSQVLPEEMVVLVSSLPLDHATEVELQPEEV